MPDPLPDAVELCGGPLDGQMLPVSGWTPEEREIGVAMISPHSAYGPGGRSCYSADPADPSRWLWEGDTP